MDLLIFLIQRRGQLVSRDEIAERLWGKDVFLDVDHSINVAVRKIRTVLRDDPDKPRFIETVVGRGYRFAATVITDNGPANPQLESTASTPQAVSPPAPSPAAKAARLASFRLKVLLGVAVLVVLAALALWLNPRALTMAKHPAIKSLAVLPLKNLSGDPSQEYLADGMTEELIGRLAQVHDLRVISRTSTMHFKNSQQSVPEIAAALHVDAILEGSVIRDGNRIRVHAQLIRAATDEHFWSETYDRELGDVLTLESEVAQSVAEKVEVTLTGEERTRLGAARQVTPEVYESYLKGRFAKGNTRADVEKRIAYFQEAIKQDATFAPAYVGLAEAYEGLGTIFIGAPPGEVRPQVMSAVQKALELDPQSAEAHTLFADIQQKQWHWAAAEAEYRRALELDPNNAAAHGGFSNWLLCEGRMEEALSRARRARELDPLGDSDLGIAWILFQSHRYDEALQEYRSMLAVRPDNVFAHWNLGFVLIADGHPDQAIPVLEKVVSDSNRSPGAIAVLIRAYAHAGRRADALRLLAELKKREQTGYVPTGAFVNAYLGLGDNEQTFTWLERAYKEQSNILQYVKVHPYFDPLRSDPRFADLVTRVGLN
jgi:TolB-like protein/DNA-binding winged helix-turn-helix (wHTH) protein/tetratricopeptide (TPR) repeat protein